MRQKSRAIITRIGRVDNGVVSGWGFSGGECAALDINNGKVYLAGWPIDELEWLAEREN